MHISVIGGGSFGTAIASALARSGNNVTLYCRRAEQAERLKSTRENADFFPGHQLHTSIHPTNDLDSSLCAAAIYLAVPAKDVETYINLIASHGNKNVTIVNLAKGLHNEYFTFAALANDKVPNANYVALKGPTFARPIFLGELSALTCGSKSEIVRSEIAMHFSNSNVSIDFCPSPEAVDAISAIKNVYAIALGLASSQGFAENTIYLMISKIISEVKSLLDALFPSSDVLMCYCGLGDLLLTGFCDTSRNRTLGFMVGKGIHIDQSKSGFLVEGLRTISLLHKKIEYLEAPILKSLVGILNHEAEPISIIRSLGMPRHISLEP